jgi:hypothetical protein
MLAVIASDEHRTPFHVIVHCETGLRVA